MVKPNRMNLNKVKFSQMFCQPFFKSFGDSIRFSFGFKFMCFYFYINVELHGDALPLPCAASLAVSGALTLCKVFFSTLKYFVPVRISHCLLKRNSILYTLLCLVRCNVSSFHFLYDLYKSLTLPCRCDNMMRNCVLVVDIWLSSSVTHQAMCS